VSIPAARPYLKKIKYNKMIDIGTRNIVARLRNHFCHEKIIVQGGSNMTGTDLYVNKPHCAAAVRP